MAFFFLLNPQIVDLNRLGVGGRMEDRETEIPANLKREELICIDAYIIPKEILIKIL